MAKKSVYLSSTSGLSYVLSRTAPAEAQKVIEFSTENGVAWDIAIGQAGSAPDPDRYMFFATRNRQPSGTAVTVVAGEEYKAPVYYFGNCNQPVRDFLFHFSGFSITEGGTSPAESQIPNATQNLDSVTILYGGEEYLMDLTSSTVAAGSNGVWASSTLPVDIAPDALFGVRTVYHGAIGNTQVPVYQIQPQRGERIYGAADLASLEALIEAGGESNLVDTASYWGPDLMIARGWDGKPVAIGLNDSIGDGRNDERRHADARGNQGYLKRWLDKDDPTYGRIPHFMMSVPGAHADYMLLETNVPGTSFPSIKVWEILDEAIALNGGKKPWTFVVNQTGQNDLDATYATLQSRVNGLLDRFLARYPGEKIIGTTLLPNTTSTDNWLTRANQSPRVSAALNGYPAGSKYVYNEYVKAGMDGRLAGYIDPYATIHDETYPGTYPPPLFTTTLAAQAGTDGTATYQTISVDEAPELGTFLAWGTPSSSNTNHVGAVTAISGTGPYVLTLDRTATQVAAEGTTVWAPCTADQVHPEEYTSVYIAETMPQAGKAQMAT